MDPDANLDEQLRIASRLIEATDNDRRVHASDVARLADLVVALDTWIRSGGRVPNAWKDVQR